MSNWKFWIALVVVGLIICLAAIVMVWKILQKQYEKSMLDYQNRMLSQEMEEVKTIYKTMRGWRHDYHNHMQSVKAYLAEENTAGAQAYLDRLETDLDQVRLLFDTGNLNVDAILNAKISLALEREIPCHYKATIPKQLSVSDIDLCVILGNLIDNAVEACRDVEPKSQFLRLYIAPMKQQFYISVSNATNELVRKLDEDYISRKRGDHGHGLKRIDVVVKKYGGYINRKNEPGVFVTEIMLPL